MNNNFSMNMYICLGNYSLFGENETELKKIYKINLLISFFLFDLFSFPFSVMFRRWFQTKSRNFLNIFESLFASLYYQPNSCTKNFFLTTVFKDEVALLHVLLMRYWTAYVP